MLVKPDVLIRLAKPGELVCDAGGWRHEGRAVRYEVGRGSARDLVELARLLEPYQREEGATIDPREGVNVQDAIHVMELLQRLRFAQIAFAGTAEHF